MGVPYIVIGDKTDHGGVVIEASPFTDTHGKKIARVGDRVTCPKKGHGTTVIATGDPTFIIDGAAAARHGDKTACGATLISSQVVTRVGDDGGHTVDPSVPDAMRRAPDGQYEPVFYPRDPEKHEFNQHVVFEDQDGNPMDGIPYTITDGRGAMVEGVTAADGKTVIVAGEEGETIGFSIGAKA